MQRNPSQKSFQVAITSDGSHVNFEDMDVQQIAWALIMQNHVGTHASLYHRPTCYAAQLSKPSHKVGKSQPPSIRIRSHELNAPQRLHTWTSHLRAQPSSSTDESLQSSASRHDSTARQHHDKEWLAAQRTKRRRRSSVVVDTTSMDSESSSTAHTVSETGLALRMEACVKNITFSSHTSTPRSVNSESASTAHTVTASGVPHAFAARPQNHMKFSHNSSVPSHTRPTKLLPHTVQMSQPFASLGYNDYGGINGFCSAASIQLNQMKMEFKLLQTSKDIITPADIAKQIGAVLAFSVHMSARSNVDPAVNILQCEALMCLSTCTTSLLQLYNISEESIALHAQSIQASSEVHLHHIHVRALSCVTASCIQLMNIDGLVLCNSCETTCGHSHIIKLLVHCAVDNTQAVSSWSDVTDRKVTICKSDTATGHLQQFTSEMSFFSTSSLPLDHAPIKDVTICMDSDEDMPEQSPAGSTADVIDLTQTTSRYRYVFAMLDL